MTGRRIYALLIRLHPPRFRQRFGEDLLATFDDAVQDRGASALLFDALASLLRQWALRPANWRKYTPTGIAEGLPTALLAGADRSYRRAQHQELLWLGACLLMWSTLPSRPNEGFFESLMWFLFISGLGSRVKWAEQIRQSFGFGTHRRPRSSGNIARNALETNVHRLRGFNPFMAVFLIFLRLSRPQPRTPFLISLVLFLVVSVLGFFLRRENRQLADRIADEIP